MVKRREPQASVKKEATKPTQEQIDAFAAAADGGSFNTKPPSKPKPKKTLDPNANRDFKAIRVPFNEYEFTELEKLAKRTGRSKLNAIRWAIMQLAK